MVADMPWGKRIVLSQEFKAHMDNVARPYLKRKKIRISTSLNSFIEHNHSHWFTHSCFYTNIAELKVTIEILWPYLTCYEKSD
jgi:hypothetical protein